MIKYSFKNKERIVNLKYMFKKSLHYNWGGWGLLSTELNFGIFSFFFTLHFIEEF